MSNKGEQNSKNTSKLKTVLFLLLIIFLIEILIFGYRKNLLNFIHNQGQNDEYYYVIFDSNGGKEEYLTQTIIKNDYAACPTNNPTREGYTFIGWYLNLKDESEYDFATPVTNNLIIFAKWQETDNKSVIKLINFYSNGGSNVDYQFVNINEKVKEPEKPTREGYTFLGWYNGTELYDFNSDVTDDLILIAKWKKNEGNPIKYYVVTFNSNGGTQINPQIIEEGGKSVVPIIPTKDNYTFLGWYNGTKLYDFDSEILTDLTLIARWKKNEDGIIKYTVTFNSDGGSNINPQTITSGNKISKPNDPSKKWHSFVRWLLNGQEYNFNSAVTNNITLTAEWKVASPLKLVKEVDLVANSKNANDMKNNTVNLQAAIDLVSQSGGGSVQLPAGTFYFSLGGRANNSGKERYVIKPKNNVHLLGAGTNYNYTNQLTILKPYFKCNGESSGSMDMFYFNNYSDTGFNNYNANINTIVDINYTNINGQSAILKNQTMYLINADFSNFVIDGEEVQGCSYKTDGKGFMINLFKDCDWNNVIVRNTDATGFGMDCPINSTINNCMAINCGKNATSTSEGASGFGIGVGLSNNESITINNSLALNNKKFGFFFEHQARFNSSAYTATKSDGFKVQNSISGGNMYDFGGLKAYDVTFNNVKSVSGKSSYNSLETLNIAKQTININTNNLYPIYFSMYSKNNFLNNNIFNTYVNDISNQLYLKEINWAINNGIISVSKGTTFNPHNNVTRFETLDILYKYNNMPGTITIKTTRVEKQEATNRVKEIGFNDLNSTQYQNDLYNIIWAYERGIVSKDNTFRPESYVKRSEYITMLYRMNGSPNITGTIPYSDVNSTSWYYNAVKWAYQKGLLKDIVTNSFLPNEPVNRTEIAVILYRYNNI